eukprot:SAG22_NODE_399_length_11094_cov_5.593452_6_plen_343_part_00
MKNRVVKKVYEAAEFEVRKEVKFKVDEAFAVTESKLLPPRRDRAPELDEDGGPVGSGVDEEVDEAGFLVSAGGFKAFKQGAAASKKLPGGVDPLAVADQVIDEPTLEALEGLLEELGPLLESCSAAALAMKEEYMTNLQNPEKSKKGILGAGSSTQRHFFAIHGRLSSSCLCFLAARVEQNQNAQTCIGLLYYEFRDFNFLTADTCLLPAPGLIPGAGLIKGFVPDPKRLLKFVPGFKKGEAPEFPTSVFLKAGLASAMEALRPELETLGGAAAERADAIHLSVEDRTTDLRKCADDERLSSAPAIRTVRDRLADEDVMCPFLQVARWTSCSKNSSWRGRAS